MRHAILSLALGSAATVATAQMSPAVRDANAATPVDWQKASPALQAAIECRAPLAHTAAVRSVLRATNDQITGDYTLPAALQVFGLKAKRLQVFESMDDGTSYAVLLEGAKLTDVARAARLRRDGPRYTRTTGVSARIEATELQPGYVELACIRGGQ